MDSGRIWSQSVARRAIMGRERTHNPSPAASALLGHFRVRAAKRQLRRLGRKRAHKGNPLPAIVGLLGGLGSLGGRFRAPSEARAGKIAPALVAAANAGNLTAAAGLIERAQKPMKVKEQQVWRLAAAQIAPKIVKAVHDYATLIPAADQSNPENFAASVMASPISLTDLEQQAKEARAAAGSAAERRAARAAAQSDVTAGRLTELGVAGLQALAGRGRQPRRRRSTRRRSQGRAFSF
jgi:hypothetical protein